MIPTEKNIAKMKAKKAGAGNIKKIDNKLIESALRDNTTQAFRIIFFLAQELSGLDLPPDDQVLKIKIDLAKITDFTDLSTREIERRLLKMQKTSIKWISKDGNIVEWTALIPRLSRNFAKNTVEIDIYTNIAKMIIDVPKHIGGTLLNVQDMARIQSKHAIRLLPILHMIYNFTYPAQKQKTYDLQELNAIFGVKKRSIWQMEKEIIEPLCEDLKTNSKMAFKYEVVLGYETDTRRGRPKALGITLIPVKRNYVQQSLI